MHLASSVQIKDTPRPMPKLSSQNLRAHVMTSFYSIFGRAKTLAEVVFEDRSGTRAARGPLINQDRVLV